MKPRLNRFTPVLVVFGGLLAAGCGANTNDLLIQYANAAATTALDQWLTGLANGFAGTPLVDSGGDDQTPVEDDDSDGEPTGLEGDASKGEALYSSNSCAVCHCANAIGGCALAAPAIIGATVDDIAGVLDPLSPHPSKPELSEQDQADLAAFLATVTP